MPMTSVNLQTGGLLQSKRARSRLMRRLTKAFGADTEQGSAEPTNLGLFGIGNPSGNLDHVMREMFTANSPVAPLLDYLLKTGDKTVIPNILYQLENLGDALEGMMGDTLDMGEDGDGEIYKSLNYAIKGLTTDEKRISYWIVYRVNREDHQGEWATPDIVEKAAHNYLAYYRKTDTEHSWQENGGVPVESYIAPCRITQFFGKSLDDDEVIEEGDWMLGVLWRPMEWGEIKKGNIVGYSLGGLKKIKSGELPPNNRPPRSL